MIGSKSIIRIETVHTTGVPTLCPFIATVMIRCTVPMTRAIRLRSCMIENGHVQFCSGRRRRNPPPDRNHMWSLQPSLAQDVEFLRELCRVLVGLYRGIAFQGERRIPSQDLCGCHPRVSRTA